VYEAGPTGYGLVRLLRSANLPAEVVAVSKTPRMTDTSAKTDRLDCQQLKPAIYPSWRSYETYLLAVSSNRACLPSNGMNAGRLSAGAVIRNVGRKGAGQASQKKVETQ
jgi:hypothetical protein